MNSWRATFPIPNGIQTTSCSLPSAAVRAIPARSANCCGCSAASSSRNCWLSGVDAEHLTFRSLRKAVAAAVSDTAGVEVARDLLGHSSTDITEGHYAKRPDLIVEVAADALDEAFAGIDA